MHVKSTLLGNVLLFFLFTPLFSQEPIDVTDQTIKIRGTNSEEIYLGFAAGDKIIFNFKEVNGKDLKEVEIIEYPNYSKFSDFKTDRIEAKTFTVLKQSVYVFRFKNASLAGRVCKIHIQRIPAGDQTRDFNTSVIWITRQDTAWNTYTKDVVIGYDTVYEQKTKKVLVRSEQREEIIMDKPQRVHSTTNQNGNKTSVFFTLPQNIETDNKTSTVIAWAYWIGVGKEAEEAWKTNMAAVRNVSVKGASYFFTTPLGALAIGLAFDLLTPKLGEDVAYAITDQQNRDLFLAGQPYKVFDNGKGVAGYRKFTGANMCRGTFFVCMSNDNVFQGVDASIKVIAIVETKEYEDRSYTDTIIKPVYEKQLFSEPHVKTYKMPVAGL